MTKNKLTKGSLSLGGAVEKKTVSELKTELVANEQRTTVYLNVDVYKAAKQYAVANDVTFKEYLNELLKSDLVAKGLL